MKYTVTVPPTKEQGSYKTTVTGSSTQTYRQEALQDYNSCRAHDGLQAITRMPAGTTYTPMYEYEIQGWYGDSWEMVTTEGTRKEAKEQIKCYRENEQRAFRIVRVPA